MEHLYLDLLHQLHPLLSSCRPHNLSAAGTDSTASLLPPHASDTSVHASSSPESTSPVQCSRVDVLLHILVKMFDQSAQGIIYDIESALLRLLSLNLYYSKRAGKV